MSKPGEEAQGSLSGHLSQDMPQHPTNTSALNHYATFPLPSFAAIRSSTSLASTC